MAVQVNKGSSSSPESRSVVFIDYVRQCYPKCDDDSKETRTVFPFYFPEALKRVLDDLLDGRLLHDQGGLILFVDRYASLIHESMTQTPLSQREFVYSLPQGFRAKLPLVTQVIFDYLGSIYLLGKIRQTLGLP